MRSILILVVPALVAGCATQSRVALQSPPTPLAAAATPTKLVETRYEVRGYRDAANPSIRHDAHAVYRRTRVPDTMDGNLETAPRSAFAPVSMAPLPASEELAAEVATQKAITTELRTMRASMAETEQRMQAQYGQLVRQSGEAVKLREKLVAERTTPRLANPASAMTETPEKLPEVKW